MVHNSYPRLGKVRRKQSGKPWILGKLKSMGWAGEVFQVFEKEPKKLNKVL